MLKKQTVWLLTMLSLIIVLSIYYILSPNNDDLAYINKGEDDVKESDKTIETDSDVEKEIDVDVTNLGGEELFATIRLDIEDERSRSKDRLKEIVASSEASTDEKNKALDEIEQIDKLSTKESILEDTILASKEYQDVLVRSEGDKIHVHVIVDQLSREEVVQIMQMVRDEFGDVTVDVNFQASKS